MISRKLRNISFSFVLTAVWASAILFTSARTNSGDISVFYFYTKESSLLLLIGGILLLALRIFRVIDKNKNFIYCFFGIANTLLGLLGVVLYLAGKINVFGIHDLLLNLLIGVLILADLFLFEMLFKKAIP
jgi:hypothetical protein